MFIVSENFVAFMWYGLVRLYGFILYADVASLLHNTLTVAVAGSGTNIIQPETLISSWWEMTHCQLVGNGNKFVKRKLSADKLHSGAMCCFILSFGNQSYILMIPF